MSEKIKYLRRSLTASNDNETALVTTRGTVPDWIDGTLFRNGPGRNEFDNNKSYLHMFDGSACVQKFRIRNGRIVYVNKLLETRSYMSTLANKTLHPLFESNSEKPGLWNLFSRADEFLTQPEITDNVNVSLVPFGDQLYALTESNRFCRIDPKTLNIIDHVNIKDYFPSMVTTLAHPHIEPDGKFQLIKE